MVTHDDRFAAHADRAVQLFDGRLLEAMEVSSA
jgi:predicted ABC-type transport system involved in lysophospholipase L1 biosynthesis ATPase subunit